jgi:hypothetical protein
MISRKGWIIIFSISICTVVTSFARKLARLFSFENYKIEFRKKTRQKISLQPLFLVQGATKACAVFTWLAA